MNLQTSLLILPPPQVQAFAAPLRERYSPVSFVQGPAHLTLFYPFVAPKDVDRSVKRLFELCEVVDPFEVTLDRYNSFETAQLLVPSDPEPIISLHKYLFSEFPEFPPYEGTFGVNLVPHLTLATFESQDEADNIQLPPPPKFTFMIRNLYLYLGPSDERIPWIPIAIIPLGNEQ
jgi:2'-5' RNA ligase